MADAEVISIGRGGAPGRGSRTTPSAAARALAPPRRTRPQPDTADTSDPIAGRSVRATSTRASRSTSTLDAAAQRRTRATPGRDIPSEAVAEATPAMNPAGSVPEEPASPAVEADDVADNLRDAARDLLGSADWERRLAGMLSFWRRRLTGEYEVDEFGFDRDVTETIILTALRPIAEKWFRIDVRGADNIPADGGALVVSNHSGTVPIDSMMTGLVIHDGTGRFLRMLGADLVFSLPFVGELARKGGATLASNEDAERLLSAGELVGVWPEGFKGIGKPFSERYKLQRFGRGGFVSAALQTGVPIVPCSVVGAEEIYPMLGNVASLARLVGVPYIPVTPLFPWLGLLGLIPLPSKWLIEFGEPIRTDSYPQGAADDPMLVFNVTDQVRETIQQTLYALLLDRGGVFG